MRAYVIAPPCSPSKLININEVIVKEFVISQGGSHVRYYAIDDEVLDDDFIRVTDARNFTIDINPTYIITRKEMKCVISHYDTTGHSNYVESKCESSEEITTYLMEKCDEWESVPFVSGKNRPTVLVTNNYINNKLI